MWFIMNNMVFIRRTLVIKNGNKIAPCPWHLNALDLDRQDSQEAVAMLDKEICRLVLE